MSARGSSTSGWSATTRTMFLLAAVAGVPLCIWAGIPSCLGFDIVPIYPEGGTGADSDTGPGGDPVEGGSDLDAGSECDFEPQVDGGIAALVCVFDIDSTLTCSHAADAVQACKDVGALLAVCTAEGQTTALDNKAGTGYVDWNALGFPTDGEALDMGFGTFMFGMCSASGSCSEEFGGAPGDCEVCSECCSECPSHYMGKAYGMSRIAEHYSVGDKTCLVLLDDLHSNTDKVELFGYSAYFHGPCSDGWNDAGTYDEVHDFLTSDVFEHCFE
jgi:hypothetical protein